MNLTLQQLDKNKNSLDLNGKQNTEINENK